ncbi:ABC transporter permease [Streptomyces sp. NRRL B-24572]|uniref:ABC transporter permease n=1 Tax=Streptomyces sp. NRRL B-24572 TaxID=1962156 RepID=UPI000A372A6E|nr:ABC transporter permease [Streptomyces sp. NRRL B-24572]
MSTLALKGSYWVTVRQYRRTLWLAAAAVIVALAVIGGLRIWDAQTPDRYYEDGQRYIADGNHGYEMLRVATEYGGVYLLFLPLLVGAFVAGPLVAREFESGTYKLSLTQSVSPATWLRAKLLTTTAVTLLTTVALMGIFRIGWVRVSGSWNLTWADRGPYEATGIVLFAYVLAAVAVGALVGLLIRRTLVAMATTGLVMGVVLLVLGAFRWDFLPVKTITGPMDVNKGPLLVPGNGLMMDTGLLTRDGRRIPEWSCYEDGKSASECLAGKNVTGQYLDFHPQSHFWPTQLIESGILLALAALAALAAFRVLRARHP